MKFRIIRYYDRYKAQVFNGDSYVDIGSPTGYFTVESAKEYCATYKQTKEDRVVEEFEL